MGFVKRNDQHVLQKHLEGKRGPRKHSNGKKIFLKADHKISTLLPDEPEQPEKQINKQTQKDLAQPGVKEVVGEEVCADVPPKISGRIFKGRDALILRPNTPDPESETQCCCEKCTAPSPHRSRTHRPPASVALSTVRTTHRPLRAHVRNSQMHSAVMFN